jgi:excisionase family DNA binding protein
MDSTTPAQTSHRLPPEQVAQIRSSPPHVMNLREAAAYLACSPRKLRYLVVARSVRSARIGAKIILRREWLDAYLEVSGPRCE